ncbi:putative pectinesterase 11 [Vitis vinifera]|uniref:pectinesterase n=2 Tax=Vitis vinifera TaxID=29760 RepID=F6I0K6_VITVI|nr:putative pectinesterase 11 [Vitis vinifera]
MGFAVAAMKMVHRGYIVVLLVELLVFCSFMASSATSSNDMSTAILIRVDQSGNGDYGKIQDAIDAVPSNNSQLYFILVKPGTYREKIVVPADKPFITLSGTQASTTIITWGDGGEIFESPTLSILASDFVGRYLTIQNTFGTSSKAVAVRVSGDRAAFYNCRILSYQDTLLDDAGRHYYRNCYIEGATDFICGSAASLFEKCHLHSLSEGNGAITAQQRGSTSENNGFTFLGCKITGVGTPYLGRPWGPYSRVVFVLSFMSSVVQPQGWDDWGDSNKQSTVYYGEYKCYGPGANRTERVEWSRSLSSDEAVPFLTKEMIGGQGWLRPAPTYFMRGSSVITMNTDGKN